MLTLLVTKFRNKYQINGTEENHIDKVIVEEVQALVSQGSTYEANLYSLDKKLEAIVKDMRAGKEPNRSNQGSRKSPVPSVYGRPGGSSKVGSDLDVRSVRSQRSAASRISGGATESKMRVYHEDRSASLNPTEEQWNDIVQ